MQAPPRHTLHGIHVLAGQFYEGILDAAAWHAALDGLRQATQGGVFHHVAWDHRAQRVVSGLANDAPPPDKVREYELHHAAHDPRIPIVMALPVGGILLDHEHFTPQHMSRNAIYADWLAPLGYRHTLGVPVYDDGQVREWICVIREAGQRPFDGDGTRGLLQALMSDLLRASRLRRHTAQLAGQAALGLAALDALPQALLLIDADAGVRYVNAAAQQHLLAPHGAFRLRHGRLRHAHDPVLQERLSRSIAAACGLQGPAKAATLQVGGGGMARDHAARAALAAHARAGAVARRAPACAAGLRPPRHTAGAAACRATGRRAGPDRRRSAAGVAAGPGPIRQGLCARPGLHLAHGPHPCAQPAAQDRHQPPGRPGNTGEVAAAGVTAP